MRSLFRDLLLVPGAAVLLGASANGVRAQTWTPNPVPYMPGTRIPSPPIYHPPIYQPNPVLYAPVIPPAMTMVPDPLNPAQYLAGVPQGSLSPAQQEYARRFIAVDEVQLLSPYNGALMQSRMQPYEGTYRRPMALLDFYQRIGGPVLEDRYRSRQRTRTGLIAGGVVALVVGLTLIGVGTYFHLRDQLGGECYLKPNCTPQPPNPGYAVMIGIGAGVGAAGAIMWPLALKMKPDPIPPDEARQRADSYNAALREQLGLIPRPMPTAPAPTPVPPSVPAPAPVPSAIPGSPSVPSFGTEPAPSVG